MRRVILSSVVCPTQPNFSTLSHKRHDFGEEGGGGVTEHKMCVLIFSTRLCETFLILRRIQLDITLMYLRLDAK